MKAPDKIYVHEISTEELTENLPYHICYIRKDALLEKLNRARELRIKGGQKESSDGIGAIDALINLINRI